MEQILKDVAAGEVRPVYLVSGDAILAEPPAQCLAARRHDCARRRAWAGSVEIVWP